MNTPTLEQIVAYAAGETPSDQVAAMEAAIRANPRASAVVNAWRAAHRLISTDDGVDPSASALARAKAIFATRAANFAQVGGIRNWIEAVDRFVAKLVYDSRLQPAAVRYADANDRVTMTFETDEGEVDLQAERIAADGGWRLMGQIAESDQAGREVALVDRASRESLANGVSDAHGEFTMTVRAGDHELLIRRGEAAIVLGPITLT